MDMEQETWDKGRKISVPSPVIMCFVQASKMRVPRYVVQTHSRCGEKCDSEF